MPERQPPGGLSHRAAITADGECLSHDRAEKFFPRQTVVPLDLSQNGVERANAERAWAGIVM